MRALKPRYFLASRSGHSTTLYLKLLKTVEAQGMTVDPADVAAPQDRAGLRRADHLPSAPRRPQRRKQQLDRPAAQVWLVLGALDRRQRRPPSGNGGCRTTPTWCATARSSSCPTTAAATAPTRAGSRPFGPSWPWPAWARTTNTATPTPKRSACCAATEFPCLRTDQLGTITITSDGRNWQVAQPALASSGRPTQADVDRVAAAATRTSRPCVPVQADQGSTVAT